MEGASYMKFQGMEESHSYMDQTILFQLYLEILKNLSINLN